MHPVDKALESRLGEAQIAISSIITEKGEVANQVKQLAALPQVTIRDREYLEDKTKGMIQRCEMILDRLESSFEPTLDAEGKEKNNFTLYGVDVYAKVVNAVAVQVRELRELNKMVLGMDLVNTETAVKMAIESKEKENSTVKMSSSDLLKLIKTAENNKEIKTEPAEFVEVSKE